MKEKPILFSAPMVRAIIEGLKTQTRRIVKPQPRIDQIFPAHWSAAMRYNKNAIYGDGLGWTALDTEGNPHEFRCHYGQSGDRLWVRETWMPDAPRDGTWPDYEFFGCKNSPLSMIPPNYKKPEHCLFRSTWNGGELVGWKPSIHMPRWASRILLEVTGVRVERLNEISEADAVAEGVTETGDGAFHIEHDTFRASDPVECYARLWESINGPGSWEANPCVWVIEFKRIDNA